MEKGGFHTLVMNVLVIDKMRKFVFFKTGFIVLLCVCCVRQIQAVESTRLDWDLCWQLARGNNRDIQNALASLGVVETNYFVSQSGYWPSIGLSSSISQVGGRSDTSSSLGLSISQPLFPGLFSKPDVKRQKALSEASKQSIYDTLASKRYTIFTAFVETAYLQETVKLSEVILKKRAQNVALVKARFEAGREHKGSYLRALAQYRQAELDLSQSQLQLSLSKKKLAQHLQIESGKTLEIIDGITSSNLVNVEYQFPNFQSDRSYMIYAEAAPSSKALYFSYAASQFAVQSKRYDFWPKLSASLSASQSLDESFSSFDDEQISGRLSLSYAYEWRKVRKAELNDALTQESIQKQKWLDQVEKKSLDIESSLLDVRYAQENLGVQKEFLDAAVIRSEIANAQYKNGLLTYENWDIIENDVISQQRQLLGRLRDVSLSQAQVALSLGIWTTQGELDEKKL